MSEPKPKTPEQEAAIAKLTQAIGGLVGTAINFAIDHYLDDSGVVHRKPSGLPCDANFGACDLPCLVSAADKVAKAVEDASAIGFNIFVRPMDDVTAAFLAAVWIPDKRPSGGRAICLAALAVAFFGAKPTTHYARLAVKVN